ncbi:unnamed protein product [Linum trigynum]|uniref:Uncharacterized protein n=1 Tax=Linum trigynum TaxID=586398 RepID=A0AAV2DJY6_9ROSI
MDFSEEWKSFFPIGSVFGAPLLLSSRATRDVLGPLCFNPDPDSSTLLFDSPALSPPVINPPSHLSFSRFLATSASAHHDSYVPLSTVSCINSSFRPQSSGDDSDNAASWLARNRIQLLRSPQGNSVIVFFPSGSNFDQIGFLVLEVKEGSLNAFGNATGGVYSANKQLSQRIRGVLVNPVAGSGWLGGGSAASSDAVIGYLLAYCIYSVHWFCVRIGGGSKKPAVVYMGSRTFKSSAVVSACWSPHLPEESVVLLENGSLFLFDLESDSSSSCFRGTRLKVSWDDESPDSGNCKWLGCELSWHPRVLIVARSDAAFLVDLRFDQYKVTCLAKVHMFGPYAPSGMTRFRAFSKAISSHFHFILVSGSLLVLCDVRRPFSPVLQWAHGLDKPCYVDTFRISDLRSNLRDSNAHKWATESGFGILLGSFFSSEFSLFPYGPPLPAPYKSIASKISEVSKSFYAWELPSSLNLPNADCICGSCLLKEEFSKDALHEWLDWKQKRDIVLGFGILSEDLCSLLHEPDEFGGFSLIRLMSSGKLELQRYSASWDLVRTSNHHTDPLLSHANNLYLSLEDERYKFPRRYKYLELDYLSAYLNGDLSKILDLKMRNASEVDPSNKESLSLDCHEALCEKLKISGLNRFRASPIVSLVLNDVNLPTSIREVALRKTWAGLPMELLQLSFSSYSELLDVLLDQKKVSLEFLPVPDLPQLPPFFLRKPSHRSNKWSQKESRDDSTLVGPILPLPVLITVHELKNGGCPASTQEETVEFSAEAELNNQCDEVMRMAKEVAGTDSTAIFGDENAVSLASDTDEIWANSQQPKSFMLYRPAAAVQGTSNCNSGYSRDHSFSTLITKLQSKEAGDGDIQDPHRHIFEDLCPIDLKFDKDLGNFSQEEAKAYNLLKRKLIQWQEQFKPYKDFCNLL